MKKVDSSNIDQIGYDPQTKIMTVIFKNGGHYEYHGVGQEHFDALEGAESIGSHFHKHIRGRFEHSKKEES